LLDSCYTDERLELGPAIGLFGDALAPADDVNLNNVIDRYNTAMGGESVVAQLGSHWTRENLLKRARALQRKQLAGNVAAPTPSRSSSVLSQQSSTAPYRRFMSSTSPDPSTASSSNAPLYDITTPVSHRHSEHPDHAVYYADLMQEAVAVSNEKVHATYMPTSKFQAPQPSVATKVKGFLYSYLSTAKKTPSAPPKTLPHKGLPIPAPPPGVFKKPRQPIITPAPKEAAKLSAPKDLVQLHPVSAKPSMIPRPAINPKRLVELNHVPTPRPESRVSNASLRTRRDSNSSVKDLIMSFENREQNVERESLSRLSSRRVHEWYSARTGLPQKPVWRP